MPRIIFSCLCIGLFNLPVLSLQEAKIEHLIRSTDEIFLAYLKDRIREDPSGPDVAPLAVLCTSVDAITNFSENGLQFINMKFSEESIQPWRKRGY